jgi:SAM-dependent methyltransferase
VDLGRHPEATGLRDPGDEGEEPRWPLRVLVCERCWLMQLDGSGPGEVALPGPPPYAISETMRDHAVRFVDDVLSRAGSAPREGGRHSPRVVELASHGAYLQPFLAERGVGSLIVEGAPAVAAAAAASGYEVLARPFGLATARALVEEAGRADLVIDNYLLAHVADPGDVIAGIAALLRPGGIAVLEHDHLLPLLADRRFDAIRHGHYSYLSLLALGDLLARNGLVVFDVAAQPVYGGALRVFVAHQGDGGHPVGPAVEAMSRAESEEELPHLATYARFADGVAAVRTELLGFLGARREAGEVVVGYGAPSRSTTLLNYCGITTELLPYTVDRSASKAGKELPGTRIPIHAPERIFETRPDFVLILTWDIRDEVIRQMARIADWGGRFVVPLPRVEVLP